MTASDNTLTIRAILNNTFFRLGKGTDGTLGHVLSSSLNYTGAVCGRHMRYECVKYLIIQLFWRS